MNTDPDFPLIDRYLDGVATENESAALAEAVEADPEALAALCEAAIIEACLRQHLATPEQRRNLTPRIVLLWHWRRAGKWIAAGAAAAALVVAAAILFRPAKPGGPGKHMPGLASGMTVIRLTGDVRGSAAPAATPVAQENAGPMEEVEFPVQAEWFTEMTNARPARGVGSVSYSFAGVFEIPVEGAAGQMVQLTTRYGQYLPEARTRRDDYLVWYLRACGVTFPPGASAHWLQDQMRFVAVNTSKNIDRITRIQQNPATMGAKKVVVYPQLWRIPEGVATPTLLQTERILTAAESNALSETAFAQGTTVLKLKPGLMAPSETQCRFLLREGDGTNFFESSGQPSPWEKVHSHLQINQWRVGDHVVISGLAGPRPGDKLLSSPPEVQNAEMEFELSLAGGEAAVLHLGRKSDGTDWILVLRASIGNVQYRLGTKPDLTLGNIHNVMRFDQTLLTVKAGIPVRLLHKNDACVLPHNFVLVKPGTAAAVGALADQMLRDPDALAKLYIPVSPDILATGTRLLALGENEEILFTAPAEPGDYPYLCTFPGHWRLQQGILRVER